MNHKTNKLTLAVNDTVEKVVSEIVRKIAKIIVFGGIKGVVVKQLDAKQRQQH